MATKTLAEKVFYKVWDIKNQMYLTASREKSVWATLNGAQAKVRDMCQLPDRYSFSPFQRRPEDFEIQMFHMVQFDRMNGREAYEAKEKKAKEEKLRLQKIVELQGLVKELIPGVDFYRIREMLKAGYFSEVMTEKISTLFVKITLLEKR